MNSVMLPGGGRSTTQLGFGCGYLSPQHARVLDAAYEAGIRHFDVARAYGRGLTEGMLGRFLKRRGGDITVTSKYGITPPFSHPLHAAARALLRPIVKGLRRSPAINQRIDQLPATQNHKASFIGADAKASLTLSLRNLGLDSIDIFLMHEPEPTDLADPSLLAVLLETVQLGRIRAFGVGGQSQYLGRLRAQRPEFCAVLQYEWTALESIPVHPDSQPILYRAYGGPVKQIRDTLFGNLALQRKWSDDIGQNLAASGMLERLMLNAALALRPDAIVLFSSTQPRRVVDNVRAATDASLSPAALRLAQLAREWVASKRVMI